MLYSLMCKLIIVSFLGDTQYFQDAKKGVLFIDFPPVLQLQLKRFEYDFMRDTMVKVGIQIETLLCNIFPSLGTLCAGL